MSRFLWSGSLSFGLVNVPVRLVSAVVDKGLHFHLLHDEDGARIKEQRVCSKDGAEVSFDHTVKGYEVGRNRFVEMTTEDFESLAPVRSRAIALERFVPLSQINPLFFQHPYYLVPSEGAESAYALLQQVLAQSERVGIARLVMRGKESLVALRAVGKALALSVLWFSDEVVASEALEGLPKGGKVPEKQLALAKQIVDSMSDDFEANAYRDEYRQRVLDFVKKKAKDKRYQAPAEAPQQSKVLDLMEALRASLGQHHPAIAKGKIATPAAEQNSAKAKPKMAPPRKRAG